MDLLVGFEAAARHLSFTKAAEELYLTQSAVSRQIKELEGELGVALFHRRHRALLLTEAGKQFYAAAAQVLTTMRSATERLRSQAGKMALSVTTTHSFAALWLIPRLAGFTRAHPGVDVRITAATRVQDLDREGLDVAIRHGPAALAGAHAIRLFGERVFPVCSPNLLKAKPLEKPADLARHVLLQYDDPDARHPWLHWKSWLEVAGIPDLRPAGTLWFSGYEQIIPAAVAGHGVGLGRTPLVKGLLASGELVAPFIVIVAKNAGSRAEVAEFVGWLREVAKQESR